MLLTLGKSVVYKPILDRFESFVDRCESRKEGVNVVSDVVNRRHLWIDRKNPDALDETHGHHFICRDTWPQIPPLMQPGRHVRDELLFSGAHLPAGLFRLHAQKLYRVSMGARRSVNLALAYPVQGFADALERHLLAGRARVRLVDGG